MTKAVAYIRVSTKNQWSKDGPERQRRTIERYAKRNGLTIAKEYCDTFTGTAEDRPALTELLVYLSTHRDTIVVTERLDRLSRTLTTQEAILAKLWQLDCTLHTTDPAGEVQEDDPDDPMRTAMRQIQGAMIQLNRSMALSRMRQGKEVKRARGEYVGGTVGYGHRYDSATRTIIDVPEEQEAIDLIHKLDAQGMSLRTIAAALTTMGYQPRGTTWHPQTIANILSSEDQPTPA